jgi:hypothetical protein
MNEFSIYEEVGKKRLRPSTSALRKRYGDITVNLLHALWVSPFESQATADADERAGPRSAGQASDGGRC